MSNQTATSVVNEAAKALNLCPNYTVNERSHGHTKEFIVDLYLGDSGPYSGTGPSIKGAKHAAASAALKECPLLNKTTIHSNPVDELNIQAMKHGVFLEFKEQRSVLQRSGMKNYENLLLPGYQAQYQSKNKPNWKVSVNIIGRTFLGHGKTKKEAKVQAAQNALKALKEEIAKGRISEADRCSTEVDATLNGVSVKGESETGEKPDIAVLYEIVAKLLVPISFSVLEEEGLNHNRKYKVSCKVGELETVGVAIGKKKAKKEAATKMLHLIRETEIANAQAKAAAKAEGKDVTNQTASATNIPSLVWMTKNNHKTKGKKCEKDLNEQMDPISYLVHLMQVRKESPPTFSLVEERVQGTERLFKMKAIVGEHSACGVANKKKDAKASAARNLLIELGIRSGEVKMAEFEELLVKGQVNSIEKPASGSRSLMPCYRSGRHARATHQQSQPPALTPENSFPWGNNAPVPTQLLEQQPQTAEVFASHLPYHPTPQLDDREVIHRAMMLNVFET